MTGPQLSKLGVNLKVRDFARSKAFYDAFGFRLLFEFGPGLPGNSPFRGLFYEVGNALLEVSEGHLAVRPEVFATPVQTSKVSLMIYVPSLVPILDIIEQRQVEVSVKPRQFPWGQMGVIVKDPDGLVLAFLSDASPDEVQRVQARTDVPLVRGEPDYSEAHVQAVAARRQK
jgi:catechol 2,3-dioxygenase-like lactoylglutathione lyase family enzyme